MPLDRDESRGSRDDSDKQTSTAEAAQEAHLLLYHCHLSILPHRQAVTAQPSVNEVASGVECR